MASKVSSTSTVSVDTGNRAVLSLQDVKKLGCIFPFKDAGPSTKQEEPLWLLALLKHFVDGLDTSSHVRNVLLEAYTQSSMRHALKKHLNNSVATDSVDSVSDTLSP